MLSQEEVKHIAGLAGLKLSKGEIKKLQEELSRTLDYIKVLDELNVEKIEPTSQVTGLKNVFRNDKIEPSFSKSEALSGTEAKTDGYFNTLYVFE